MTVGAGPQTPPAALPADDPPLGPPRHPGDLGGLGAYRVVRPLGRGGMGVVYLGFDTKLRRKVALKVMRPRFLARPAARDRFVREARAVAAVRSEHVVTVYQVDDGPLPFIALEYLRGTSLEAYLQSRPAPELPAVLRVGREIARGLADAHALGVIHRDVKPDNVWLEAPHGKVKLIDFGLARLTAAGPGESADGPVLGTPAYMSPEQARGEPADHRSDLFSLGVVLFRLATGRLPYTAATPVDHMAALLAGPPPPVATINPRVPDRLAVLIDRLLAPDPARRPRSAESVADELGRIEAEHAPGWLGVAAVPVPAADSTWATLAIDTGPPTPPPAGGRAAAGLLVAAAAALGLAAAGLLAGLLARPANEPVRVERPDPPRPPAARRPGPPAEWVKRVADAPADEQVRLVEKELALRNREFEGADAVTPTIADGKVVGLRIESAVLTDLSPAAALPHLRALAVTTPGGKPGRLTDLAPLADTRLAELRVPDQPVTDLAPLAGLPLETLDIAGTAVADLRPLAGLPLTELAVGPKPTDLAPVSAAPLRRLTVREGSPAADSPVRRCRTLETINGVPAAAHWARQDRRRTAAEAVPARVFRSDVAVRRLTVSADGGLLAAVGDSLRLWDLGTGRRLVPGWRDRVVGDGLAGFMGRTAVVVESDNRLHLRPIAGGEFGSPTGFGGFLLPTAADPAGRWVAAAAQPPDGQAGHPVAVIDPDTGQRLGTAADHAGRVRTLTASADGRFLVTGGDDAALRRWDATSREKAELPGPTAGGWRAVAFAPAGHTLAGLAADGTVALWADAGRTPLGRWTVPGAAAVATDGRRAAVGLADGWVEVYEPGSPAPVREFAADRHPVTAVGFAPDGKALFTGHGNHGVRGWGWPALFVRPPADPGLPAGYAPLFTGTDLAGWRPGRFSNPAAWRPRPGGAVADPAAGWGWLVTDTEYAEFELRLEYRWRAPGGDSGVAFWADLDGTPADTGLEVLLNDDANFPELHPDSDPDRERTGGIWRFTEATVTANRPLGEWNEFVLTVRDGRVRVRQNGTTLTDVSVAELRARVDGHKGLARGRGRIGLQANQGGIEFRNVGLKP